MSIERLCIFTRYPEAGTTKTRLIPALGPDAAASLQYAMTTHLLNEADRLQCGSGPRVEVRFEGGDGRLMRDAFGASFAYHPQGEGDLGDRMRRCVRDHFASGGQKVVIVGADVPGVDAGILSDALDGLDQHDLVIGPAQDGGYYLIGLRADVPDLFENMPWGTDSIFRRTLDAAEYRGLSVCRLPALADVDRPEDLDVLRQAWGKERVAEAIGSVSVIIPTLNEASRIDAVLKALRDETHPAVEIIIADGGSNDGTVAKAEAGGATVLITDPGRAKQMNAGADAATGDILLFLHADTGLPENVVSLIRATLRRPGVVAGAFAFRLDAEGWGYRLLERLVNWRSRVLQMPYGDQALFMTAETFRALGGFPDLLIMEDYEMVRRLKHCGRIAIAPESAVTSARRWQERGFLKTSLLNQLIIVGYCLKLPHHKLAHWYRSA